MSNPDTPGESARLTRSPINLEDCGLSATAELIGDRWTLLVLRSIFYGVCRFADIKADIGIPGSTLSNRLRMLIDAGLLDEHPYRDGNARSRVEYRLTPEGQTLRNVLMAMMNWGDRNLRRKEAMLRVVSKTTGEELELGWVDKRGRRVDAADIDYVIRP